MEIKKMVLCLFALLSLVGTKVWAQSYDDLWKVAETNSRRDLPKQRLASVQKIFDKAANAGDFAQMVKAWAVIVEANGQIDPDSFMVQRPLVKCKGAVETAIYNAILGTGYQAKAQAMRGSEDARTEYESRARECFALTFADIPALAKKPAADYIPLVELGEDSQIYGDDLLMVMLRYMDARFNLMETEAVSAVFAKAINYYQSAGNREAWALASLLRINWQQAHGNSANQSKQLQQLYEQTVGLDANAQIAYEYMDAITNKDTRLEKAKEWVETFRDNKLRGAFENTRNNLLAKSFRARIDGEMVPDHPFKMQLEYTNMESLDLKIREFAGKDKYGRPYLTGKLIESRHIDLASENNDYARRLAAQQIAKGKREVEMTLGAGHYVWEISSGGISDASDFHITSLFVLSIDISNDSALITVLDNERGRPVPNATIRISYDVNSTKIKLVKADRNGEYRLNKKGVRWISALKSEKDFTENAYISNIRSDIKKDREHHVNLFTDRAIYRPGQEVNVAALAWWQEDMETSVEPGKGLTLTLYDANSQKVSEQTVTTDDIGTASATFNLPIGLLPGTFSIRCSDGGSVSFRVEEYKRPTFRLSAKSEQIDNEPFAIGDTVSVECTATALTGVAVQGAQVNYTVTARRDNLYLYRSTDKHRSVVISQGTATTDSEGHISVDFALTYDDMSDDEDGLTFDVLFEATDMAGETQSTTYSFNATRQPFIIDFAMNGWDYDLQTDNYILVNALNTKRKKNVARLRGELEIKDSEGRTAKTVPFITGDSILLPRLEMGTYYLTAKVATEKGNTLKHTGTRMNAYDLSTAIYPQTRMTVVPTKFDNFFIKAERAPYTNMDVLMSFSEDKPATIYFSPAHDDVMAFCQIFGENGLIERKTLLLNRGMYKLDIPYKPEYGKKIEFQMMYVRNGSYDIIGREIEYAIPEKKLKLTWQTFRDRLTPGQEEEWVLTIRDKDGNAVKDASLLATMYDKSLDLLTPHNWSLPIRLFRKMPYYALTTSSNRGHFSLGEDEDVKFVRFKPYSFSQLTTTITRIVTTRGPVMYKAMRSSAKTTDEMNDYEEMVVAGVGNVMELSEVAVAEDDSEPLILELHSPRVIRLQSVGEFTNNGSEKANTPQVYMRNNFCETAFFYPSLKSDEQGNVRIRFTLPESLTEWRILGLAHTANLDNGRIDATVIARKEFMVQPNMPRFLRAGDKATISARIVNQTDKAVSGKAVMRLLDAKTLKLLASQTVDFSAEAKQTTAATFNYTAAEGTDMLVCEITAEAGGFSDGERNYLPVLPSRQHVIETIPYYIYSNDGESAKGNGKNNQSGKAETTVDLSTLFNGGSKTATEKKLTVEFTANPSWTIVEALKSVKDPENESAISYAAALYANTRAAQLAQQIPGLEEAMKRASNQSPDAIASELQTNPTLRDILLQESPWVVAALDEAGERRSIIELFNSDLIGKRTEKAITYLQKTQQNDGGWPWFDGMRSNAFITLSIAQQLHMSESADNRVQKMLSKAIDYLDREELRSYENAKKWTKDLKKLIPSESTLQYLALRAEVKGLKGNKAMQEMTKTYLDNLQERPKQLTIYGKAIASNILRADGRKQAADEFLQSLIEYSVTKPGMGRYFATEKARYSWRDYKIPTQIAAMKAIDNAAVKDGIAMLNDMQLWLLRQKQTQHWDNPMSTIEAVDFLLRSTTPTQSAPANKAPAQSAANSPFPAAPSQVFTLATSKSQRTLAMPLDTTKLLAEQLGYRREQLTMETENAKSLRIERTGNGNLGANNISWGAVYAEFMEDISAVKSSSSGELRIKQRIMKDGKDAATLKVGDRATLRLTLNADRDMDFVQIHVTKPACFESTRSLSGYTPLGTRHGYVALHDASTDIFFDQFQKGEITIDLDFYVTRAGEYQSGITTMQCAYSTDFKANAASLKVIVNE